jgi:5S rRNA maturation endonuclease (ribonuclease M5)
MMASERLGEIEDALAELADCTAQGEIILVEGKKDVAALRTLGIPGRIEQVNLGTTLIGRAEDYWREGVRSIIILTDWDHTGGSLARRLREAFMSLGVRPNLEHRRRLARLVKGDISAIEALPALLDNLRRQVEEERGRGVQVGRT